MIDLSWINVLIPYMIPLFIAVYAIKWVNSYMADKERKKVVDKPRNSQDRIYIGFKNVAKRTSRETARTGFTSALKTWLRCPTYYRINRFM